MFAKVRLRLDGAIAAAALVSPAARAATIDHSAPRRRGRLAPLPPALALLPAGVALRRRGPRAA